MKYEYKEVVRYWNEKFPKLKNNEQIVSAIIDGAGGGFVPPIMILVVQKSIPFKSRIRK